MYYLIKKDQMKKIIKKKTIHCISDDLSNITTTITITFLGVTIFKTATSKNVSLSIFN